MNRLAAALLPLALAGCGGIPEDSHPLYGPVEPIDYSQLPQPENNGGLYTQGRYLSLFADVRAAQVGDIVSIVLVESTDASKSADTALDRASGIDIGNPTVFGKPVSINGGEYDLSVSAQSESNFAGEAESSQSNSLQGSIAVQVSEVLPNGNLVVQGEKWIRINQGDEYIRLRGIIRPQDLSPTNTIPSTRVADARISYSGIGVVDETNTPGWLTRFFMSPLMPF
jgi:flagellar L-ring protein precursor FlgH